MFYYTYKNRGDNHTSSAVPLLLPILLTVLLIAGAQVIYGDAILQLSTLAQLYFYSNVNLLGSKHMYVVRQLFKIADRYCVSVEGDSQQLKNGIKLKDEKGNIFIIESIGMINYKNINDYKRYAELLLTGDVTSIGERLVIVE